MDATTGGLTVDPIHSMLPITKALLGFGVAWLVGLVEYGFNATAAGGPFAVVLLPVVAAVFSVVYTGCAALVGLLLRLPKLRTGWREAGPRVLWLAVLPLLILVFSAPLGLRTIDPDSRYSLMSPWLSALCYFLIAFPIVNLPTTGKAVAPPLPPTHDA